MSIIFLQNDFTEDSGNIADLYHPFSFTGLGVFDSMAAIDGECQNFDYHLERFCHDANNVMGAYDPSGILKNSAEHYRPLLSKNNLMSGHARIRTVMAADNNNDIIFFICTGREKKPENTPITCAIIEDYPREAGNILENCKRLDYSRSVKAREKAQSLGAEEAILTNTEGNIACGATSNIFIEEDGVLMTPPLSDGVLAGVTRRKIIEEREVIEESITPEKLKNATRAFLTNSFIGLREIQKII